MKKIFRILGKRGRITVPFEIRQSVGFKQNDILSFSESEGTVVVRRVRICDCKKTEGKEEVTLYDFLNGLTPEQQRAALVHLSVKWAQAQGAEKDGGA